MSATEIKWTRNPGARNYMAQGDGFYVSYNPNTHILGSPFGGDGNGSETALKSATGRYLILNGDWRKEYEELIPKGFDACRAFFDSKKDEHRSSWSED